MKYVAFIFCFLFVAGLSAKERPIELGKVNWIRSIDVAVERSEESSKPIFVLFQEVPGCSTCRQYGKFALSHPLIIEAIEDLFVPLAIFNNKQGKDAEALSFFKEPSWNNPVVRIIDKNKTNLVKRHAGDYSRAGLIERMIEALEVSNQEVPEYLRLIYREEIAKHRGLETARFKMFCFWTGEKILGQIEGVISSFPGFANGGEVVEVLFDPKVISKEELKKLASFQSCKAVDTGTAARPDNEPKYYLSKSTYKGVPMTALQQLKANSLIGQNSSPEGVLSPRQLALFQKLKRAGDVNAVISSDFEATWWKLQGA